jgi:hypothetical protein
VAAREREILEQRRVLAEQYRLLHGRPLQTGVAPGGGAAVWPPSGRPADAARSIKVDASAFGRVQPGAPRFDTFQRKRAGLWRRVRHTLLGTSEPVMEDSL